MILLAYGTDFASHTGFQYMGRSSNLLIAQEKKRICLQFSRKATLAESQTSSVSNLSEMCPDIQTHLTSTS